MMHRSLSVALLFVGIVLFVSQLPIGDVPSVAQQFYIVVSLVAAIFGAVANIISGGE